MTTIEVIRREVGPFSPGTPGNRAQVAVANAEHFITWLESKGWERVDDSTEEYVRLTNDSPHALRRLSEYGSKPRLSCGKEAWCVIDAGN